MKIKNKPKELSIREMPEYEKIMDNIFDIFDDSKLNYFEVIGILDTVKSIVQKESMDIDCDCEDCDCDNEDCENGN